MLVDFSTLTVLNVLGNDEIYTLLSKVFIILGNPTT